MVHWTECSSFDLILEKPASERFRDIPDLAIKRALSILTVMSGKSSPSHYPIAHMIAEKTGKRFQDEVEALGSKLGISWEAILLANVSYDLEVMLMGCSTAAIPTPEGPVLARNLDWDFQDFLGRGSYLMRYMRKGKPEYMSAGWAGAVGAVTGMSPKGFSLALNCVIGPEKVDITQGYPVLLFLRRVLEDAGSFEEAVTMVSTEHLMAPGLITIVGTNNDQRVCVERSQTSHFQRWAEPEKVLCTTNNYIKLFDGKDFADMLDGRLDAMKDLTKHMDGHSDVEDETILSILTNPDVIQENTAQHVISRPSTQTMKVWCPSKFFLEEKHL